MSCPAASITIVSDDVVQLWFHTIYGETAYFVRLSPVL